MDILIHDQYINSEKLLIAFNLLGEKGHRELDYEQFVSLLLMKGERLTKKEILAIFNEEKCCKNGKLDIIKFCVSILSTAVLWNKMTDKNIKENYNGRIINSRTFTRKRGIGHSVCSGDGSSDNDLLNCDNNTQNWNSRQLRGCFFTCPSGILSHQYILELCENSSVWITLGSISISGNVNFNPVSEILVFLESEGSSKILIAVSTCRNVKGHCTVNANLKKGRYLLIPVVLNYPHYLQSYQEEISVMYPLINIDDNGKTILSSGCHNALISVFNCIDLDQNGLLSKQEFELFIQYTSNETAAEEWPTVEENFEMQNGELTFDGFLTLYQMAVETDPQDVYTMFQKMGFDNFLCMKQAFPFILSVGSEAIQPVLLPMPISSSDHLVEKALCKTAVEQGFCTKVCNMNDLALYIHKLPQRAAVVVQNQSHSTVRIRLDCSKSENCSSHRQNLDYTVQIPQRTCVIGHHLFPIKIEHPWTVVCMETLVK